MIREMDSLIFTCKTCGVVLASSILMIQGYGPRNFIRVVLTDDHVGHELALDRAVTTVVPKEDVDAESV